MKDNNDYTEIDTADLPIVTFLDDANIFKLTILAQKKGNRNKNIAIRFTYTIDKNKETDVYIEMVKNSLPSLRRKIKNLGPVSYNDIYGYFYLYYTQLKRKCIK